MKAHVAVVSVALLARAAGAQWYDGDVWGDRTEHWWFGLRTGQVRVFHENGVFRGQFTSNSPPYPFDYIVVAGGRCDWWNFWNARYGTATGVVEQTIERDGRIRWRLWITVAPCVAVPFTFDEARDVAKSRRAHIRCLLLLDDMDAPRVHYVR